MAGNARDVVQGKIYYFGVWEPNLTDFIKRRLKNQAERIFVDVGANVGYFSILASKLMPKGGVVSIEAFPSIYEKLQYNILINQIKNIRTIPYAATDKPCQIQMFHAGPKNEGATTSLAGRFQSTPVSVGGKPLSDLLTVAEIQSMRLMKIDVEGAEYSVIQGMHGILGLLQPDAELIVEIAPETLANEKLKAIFNLFEEFGYMPYGMENSYENSSYLRPGKISRPKRLRSLPSEQTDIVFSKVDSEYL